ncbi:membrane protein [Bathymodiolus azoricus thioautotrophic gill symbiont]|uniref:Membrane protein n=1 Tax=Bathymodiolus azoricus thioautotrophic gill symbiont TaxID=235205 RepID=A0A1H6KH52_9GAMM|nr:membrane protein [Bathymodiolus azoricus thioautotrophic gill symbiont]
MLRTLQLLLLLLVSVILIWPLENMPHNPVHIYTTLSFLLLAMQWMVILMAIS